MPAISMAVPRPSTMPLSAAWNSADAVSSLSLVLPGSVFGAFTNSFASSVMYTKSDSAASTASPPPHFPKIIEICGTTPEQRDFVRYKKPKPSSASVTSSRRSPEESSMPTIGAPIFIASS